MSKIYTFLFILLLVGCAPKIPSDAWKFYASVSYKNYEYFLLTKDLARAQSQYKKAVHNAKAGSDFGTLKRVYLARCALEKSLFFENKCDEYLEVASLDEKPDALTHYYRFISSRVDFDANELPEQYRSFGKSRIDGGDFKSELFKIQNPISRMVAAMTIIDKLSNQESEKIIEALSFNGYKFAVERWIEHLYQETKNETEKKRYAKQLEILRSTPQTPQN